jgi:hypothetical protein
LQLVGTIVRLQVQRARLKPGEKPWRRYDPTPILAVQELRLTPVGVVGRTGAGEEVVDVHNRDHPDSRYRGENGVSVGFTAHYQLMRDRFGAHLADGIAGENVLVETDRPVHEADAARGLLVETAGGGKVRLDAVMVAEPCVEFSRFALRHPDDAPSDEAVAEALRFLRGGMRGFYATHRGETIMLQTGSRVCLS